jgi:hypothetical protein
MATATRQRWPGDRRWPERPARTAAAAGCEHTPGQPQASHKCAAAHLHGRLAYVDNVDDIHFESNESMLARGILWHSFIIAARGAAAPGGRGYALAGRRR